MSAKPRSDLILRQIAKRHKDDAFYLEVKNGPTWFSDHLLRLDAIAFKRSWKKPCVTGYEVKVNRQDFLRDDKWPGYRQYCHRFYFACPAGLIKPEELPEDVGLIYYNPEKDCISTKRTALFRDAEIPWEMLYYLVTSRDEAQKHPFFSSTREFFEAWIVDKEEKRRLGYMVQNKMAKIIDELSEQLNETKAELERAKKDCENLKQIKRVLHQYGINTYWDVAGNIQKALQQKIPPALAESLSAIEREVKRLNVWIKDAG